jgi:thioredoxin 1
MADLQLTDSSFEGEVLKADKPVLVDFWAPWCGPCRMLSPLIDELAKEYDGKIKMGKLNTDENAQVATRFKISAIPTLLFFKGGKMVDQLVGVHPKPEIKKRLDAMLVG